MKEHSLVLLCKTTTVGGTRALYSHIGNGSASCYIVKFVKVSGYIHHLSLF